MKFKKRKGEVSQFLVPLLGMFFIFVVLLISTGYVESTIKYINANIIARKYILKMESYGYLTSDLTLEMKNKLSDQGFKNIDLSGTTFTEVNHADDVILDIKYDQTIHKIAIQGFSVKAVAEVTRIEITRSSTAMN